MAKILYLLIFVLLYGNSITDNNISPPNSFQNYIPLDEFKVEYEGFDFGDRGECLLFGNKISFLYIKASLYILNNENWKTFNIEDFNKRFLDSNKFQEGTYDINIEKNLLIKMFVEDFLATKKEKTTIVKFNQKNSYSNY